MSREQIQERIDQALSVSSVAALHQLCSGVRADLAYDHFSFGTRFPNSFVSPLVLLVTGQPPEWRERYAEAGYLTTDPMVRHSLASARPLIWEDLEIRQGADSDVGQFLRDARAHGLVSGVSVPVHGSQGEVSVLSLSLETAHDKARAHVLATLPEICLVAFYVHEAACRLMRDSGYLCTGETLTRRERECLLWAAEGKTSWETAQILHISERTVIFHLRNAAGKLGVSTRQQAVARAVAQRLIAPHF